MFFDCYLFQFIFSFLPFNICSLSPFHTLLSRLLHTSFVSVTLCSYVLILPSPISFFILSSLLFLARLSITLPFSAVTVLNFHLPIFLRPHCFHFPYSLLDVDPVSVCQHLFN